MNKLKPAFLGMALLLVSLACVITIPVPGGDSPAAAPVDSPAPSSTPSKTLRPTTTPFPTPTRRATSTDLPTITPPLTVLAAPSLTPDANIETLVGGNPTATNSGVKLAIWSPTPASLQCKAEVVKPLFGEDIKPRTDFMAIWRLYNVGTSPWASGEFTFEYVDGTKLHSRDYIQSLLSFTVYVEDKVRFDVRLKSPKEPGRYTTTWGMRRVNKKEPFCTFSITIDVVK